MARSYWIWIFRRTRCSSVYVVRLGDWYESRGWRTIVYSSIDNKGIYFIENMNSGDMELCKTANLLNIFGWLALLYGMVWWTVASPGEKSAPFI